MKQLPGFISKDASKVCFYGFKQAARSWNEVVHKILIEGGFQQSKEDQCLYSKFLNNNWCYILIYVDDIVVVGKMQQQIQHILSIF